MSICKMKLWCPSPRSPLKRKEVHFHAFPQGDKKKKKILCPICEWHEPNALSVCVFLGPIDIVAKRSALLDVSGVH